MEGTITIGFIVLKYSRTLVCKCNSFQKHACNPKDLYMKANFPIRDNGNSDDSFHNPKIFIQKCLQYCNLWGTCMDQLVKHTTSAQVMIVQFGSLSPMSGSVLTDQSLEPASDSVSPSLSAPPYSVSLSFKTKQTLKKILKKEHLTKE